MSHLHSVYDSDFHFVIDPTTRAIKNESGKTTIIQHDHNSERFTFELPRYIDGHDMSLCDRVEVHYINVSANKADQSKDVYLADDMQISRADNNVAIFSWLISGNATKYEGYLNFLIRFICFDGDIITYVWNTAIHGGISVGEGMNNSEADVEEYSDILETWKNNILKEIIYYVSGVWKLPANTGEFNPLFEETIYVNFTAGGRTFKGIKYNNDSLYYIDATTDEEVFIFEYDIIEENDPMLTIDHGVSPQSVSAEYVAWLQSYAKDSAQIEIDSLESQLDALQKKFEESQLLTISGSWELPADFSTILYYLDETTEHYFGDIEHGDTSTSSEIWFEKSGNNYSLECSDHTVASNGAYNSEDDRIIFFYQNTKIHIGLARWIMDRGTKQ